MILPLYPFSHGWPVTMNGGPAQRPRGALAWGPGRSAGNHKALGSSGRGRGPRPPAPHFGEAVSSSSLGSFRPMLPARTARTPRPQQNWFRATRA